LDAGALHRLQTSRPQQREQSTFIPRPSSLALSKDAEMVKLSKATSSGVCARGKQGTPYPEKEINEMSRIDLPLPAIAFFKSV